MSQFWSPQVHTLDPYVPGEQPKDQQYIKLNTNECPYPPSPATLEAIQQAVQESLRLYPDPNASELKQAMAAHHQLKPEQVFVGNGSDEVLAHIYYAFFQQDKPLLYPDISYSFYPVYANLYKITAEKIPLRNDFSIQLADYERENGGIIFANPNAPTGSAVALADIERLLQHNTQSVVVVDEAYVDFGATSAVGLIDQYPNLLVVQTLSKSHALAGLRVGMAMGHVDLIDALERVKNSFNSYPIDRLAIAGATAAMRDQPYYQRLCEQVMQTREWTRAQLGALDFHVLPSVTNFLFARPTRAQAENLYLALKQAGILVRYFNKPLINEYLRITIGTDAQMQALIKQLKVLLT